MRRKNTSAGMDTLAVYACAAGPYLGYHETRRTCTLGRRQIRHLVMGVRRCMVVNSFLTYTVAYVPAHPKKIGTSTQYVVRPLADRLDRTAASELARIGARKAVPNMSRHIVEQRDKKKGGLIDLIFQVDRVRDDRGHGRTAPGNRRKTPCWMCAGGGTHDTSIHACSVS